LKLAPLLAQYLYNNKKLDLPGIGSFQLDASAVVPDTESGKQQKSSPAEGIKGIHFENNPSIKDSEALINYISSQTGKMKALAAADLCSHLELVQQFLNIGKPFLLEGIGSLVKIKSGQFEFTSGLVQPEKLKDLSVKEATVTSATEESFSSYDNSGTRSFAWKKPVMVLLILIGAGLAIWGGYTVYKNSSSPNVTAAADTQLVQPVIIDSTAIKDSLRKAAEAEIYAGKYKFVLETANKPRALERYTRLKNFEWNVQMETKDSVQYKLFMILPALATDTTRLMDSLTALNGRKVYIEKLLN
jgi:hypothetical protein